LIASSTLFAFDRLVDETILPVASSLVLSPASSSSLFASDIALCRAFVRARLAKGEEEDLLKDETVVGLRTLEE
jgi:hypothetical protein